MKTIDTVLNGREYTKEKGFYDGRKVKKYYGVDSHDKNKIVFESDKEQDVFVQIYRYVKDSGTIHVFYIFADFGNDKPLLLVSKY